MRFAAPLLILALAEAAASGTPPTDPEAEYASRSAALGEKPDPKGWLALADFAEDHLLWDRRAEALARVVAQDPDHAAARARRGEVKAAKAWRKAEEAEAEEAAAMLAKGLVLYGDRWTASQEAERARSAERRRVGWDFERKLGTSRLLIYSDRSLEATRDLAALLESELDAYRRLHGPFWKPDPRPQPFVVYCFGDRETFLKVGGKVFRGPGGGIPEGAPAFYDPISGILFVGQLASVGEPSDALDSARVAAVHEMLHGMDHRFAGVTAALPAWILEGRGNYFGYSAERRKLLPGSIHPPPNDASRDALAAAVERASLPDLVSMNQEAFARDPGRNYPLAWAFVHFLYHGEGGRHAGGFRRFLAGLPTRSSAKDLETALGCGVETLEAGFRDHVRTVLLPLLNAALDGRALPPEAP